MPLKPVARFSIALALALIVAVIVAMATAGAWPSALMMAFQRVEEQQAAPGQVTGQTVTRLADGRWLILGGEGPAGPTATAVIVHPNTGQHTTLTAQPRAWHTATVLPDGTVLIVGGIGLGGQVAGTVDIFDPTANVIVPLGVDGSLARARHSATLLPDGRVLIVGGIGSDGEPRNDGELWDLGFADSASASGQAQSASRVAVSNPVPGGLADPRADHRATLLPDGRVLIEGAAGEPEVFDPAASRFTRGEPMSPESGPARLAGSDPSDRAVGVHESRRLVLRFTQPLRLDTLSPATVSLTGPDGRVEVSVVGAEGGRLAFVTSRLPLALDTSYVLAISGAVDDDGQPLVIAPIAFTTRADDAQRRPEAPDTESWLPGAEAVRNGWRTNRPDSPWQDLPPLFAPSGVTALAGQVLRLDGQPLAGVTLEMEGRTTKTDRTGRFLLLLSGLGSGWCELLIDGKTASLGNRVYGVFEVGHRITERQTTVLPYTIWMPRIDTTRKVAIPSPTSSEVIVKTPLIPGLELHLPRGTVIRDHDGTIVREVSITPIPVDRPPFPLAENVDVPVYFTIQPGAAYVYSTSAYGGRVSAATRTLPQARTTAAGYDRGGAWLVYPNFRNGFPGKRVQFFHYDPNALGWYVYGLGTVTPNGAQVVPDRTTRIYEFTGAMIGGGPAPPTDGEPPGDSCGNGADPVNLWTGLFKLEQTDLYLPDVIPISLTRTYRTRDWENHPFGKGTTHPYAMFLFNGAAGYQEADMVLPDGAKIHFVRTSAGVGFTDAVFQHKETETTSATPTAFYKAVMTWNGLGWDIRLKDGTVYVFGENAPLQAIRDRYGNTVSIIHANGQSGNITRVMSPHGRWIEFTYDTSNRITQAKDNIGRIWGYTYDAGGRLWKVTDPLSQLTEYTYDGYDRMKTVKNRNGVVIVTNEYDEILESPTFGWVKKQTLADGAVYEFTYTVVNGKSTQTDVKNPRGYTRRVTFNPVGYTLTTTNALGTSVEQPNGFTRHPATNQITGETDPAEAESSMSIDPNGNVLQVTQLVGTPSPVSLQFSYDARFSQVDAITDPLNHTLSFEYDDQGNVRVARDALNREATFDYDTIGRLISTTDPLQHTSTIAYSGPDVRTVTDHINRTSTFFTDAIGRVLSVTNPAGGRTTYTYDVLGRRASIVDPIGGEVSFGYKPEGQVESVTDARSLAIHATYDDMGRLSSKTDGLDRVERFFYDLNGNLTKRIDRNGAETTWTYDPLDRLERVTFSDGATIQYTFDAQDRLTEIVDSARGTTDLTYDALGRVTSEDTPQGRIDYTYDDAGRRTTMTVEGVGATQYGYDDVDQLTSVTHGSISATFEYDDDGRRTRLVQPNGVATQYAYDDAHQLTSITVARNGQPIGDVTYALDALGRRSSVTGTLARVRLPLPIASATYDNGNRLIAWNGNGLSYDDNGSLVSDGLRSYQWNARGQLAAISGDLAAAFEYDSLGRRTARTIDGITVNLLHDDISVVQESGAASTVRLLGPRMDEVLALIQTGAVTVPVADGLASILELRNEAGDAVGWRSYEPYGATAAVGQVGMTEPLFSGREQDGANGLYYYRARYYSPTLHRFISSDPLPRPGQSPYEMVGSDPVNFVDPLGLLEWKVDPYVHDFRILPPDETQRVCGGRVDLGGCNKFKIWKVDCDCTCGPDGKCRLKMNVELGGALVVLSNQPPVAIDIVENHEYGHLQDKLQILNDRRAAAEELERRTFPSKAKCMFACENWKSVTDAQAARAGLWRDFLKEFGIR